MKHLKTILIVTALITTNLFSQTHITTDTEWTTDQILTGAVIVDAGATLTIAAGVQVQTFFIDADADNIGDVEIEVLGELKINGTPSNPVLFKPYETTTNKNYWTGIVINSTSDNDTLNFFEIHNAYIGLNALTVISIKGCKIYNTGYYGISIQHDENLFTTINDIQVYNGDGIGVYIDGLTSINWGIIDSLGSHGMYIHGGHYNNAVWVDGWGSGNLNNVTIQNNGGAGIYLEYSDSLTVNNTYIKSNSKYGIFSKYSNCDILYSDIESNGYSGVVVWGDNNSTVSINYSSISNNNGNGVDISDFQDSSYPNITVNNTNLIDNYSDSVNVSSSQSLFSFSTTNTRIGNCQQNGCYANCGNQVLPETSGTGETPIGFLSHVKPSLYGGSTTIGQFVRMDIVDAITNTTLWRSNPGYGCSPNNGSSNSASSAFSYLPLASDKWYFYVWSTQGAHNTQYGISLESSATSGNPTQFGLGGYEVSSTVNSNVTYNFQSNFWNTFTNISDLFYQSQYTGQIDYSSFQVFEVADAHSTVDETDAISLTSPVAAASYETATYVDVTWTSDGWVPVVNIAISTDLGSTWSYLSEGIANTGTYSWWNDLTVGETVYLKIEDSYDTSVSSQVGPFFVIENSTPIIGVSTTTLEFDSTLSSLTFNIVNNGGGTLNWTATDDQDWLSISSASGATSDQTEVTVTVDRTGMNPGDYTGTISITSDGGNATVGVNMTVAQPVMSISPTSLDFDSTLIELPFYISNTGGGSFTWTATPSTNWLAVNPTSGTTMTQDTVLVTVDRSLTTSGVHTGLIIFSSSVGNTSISISLSDIGDAPVADAQTVITDEDTPVSITLSGTDADGDDLTYSVITNPTIGALSGTAPNLTYTPNTDVYGSDSLTFKANDGTFDSDPATVTIVINSINDGPSITLPESFTYEEDGSLVVDFAPYVSDVDGDVLTLSVTENSEVTVGIVDYGVTFGASDNWNGTETLIFTVDDSQGRAVAADSVYVIVTSVNDVPVANAGIDSTYESPYPYGPVDVTLDGSGSNDIDGNIVSYIWTESGTQVADVVSPTLTLELGNYAFTLTVTDNEGGTDSDDAIINVIESPNTAPVADDQTVITDEEVPLAITLTATDSENDPLTFSVVTNPSNGTLSGTAPNLTYSPNADYTGVDIFTFVANDGVFDSDSGTVTITVTPVNDPPAMSEINDVTIDEDNSTQPISFTLTDVDTDLEWILLSGVSSNNDLVDDFDIVFDGDDENRTVTITPLPNAFGTTTITIIANDEPTANFHVTINTDAYPGETSWSLFDSTSTLVVTEGPLTQSNNLYEWDVTINAGVYTFVIYDSYGDGICCTYGDGYYTISVNDIEVGSGSEFTYSESTTFSTSTGTFRIERVSFTNPLPYEKGMEISFPNGIEQYLSPPVVIFEQPIPENDRDTSTVSFTLIVNSVNDPPATFSLSNPSNNYTLVIDENNLNDDFSFSWSNTGDADGDDLIYELMASGDLQFLNTSNIENTNSINWLITDILDEIDYGAVVTGTWDVIKSDGIESVESSNGPRTLTIDASALSIDIEFIPEVYALHQNYPNPFNPITTLRYDLPEDAQVRIIIFDITGRKIKSLVNDQQSAGFKSVIWDATNESGQPVSAGMYLYRISAGEFHQVKKMVLLK